VSAPDFGKPFEELSEAEVQVLSDHDWAPAQIMAAISMALREHDMEAAASLVRMLAVKDPASAELIVAAVDLLRDAP
jgi:hypothetical protein